MKESLRLSSALQRKNLNSLPSALIASACLLACASESQAQRALGVDVSSYQGPSVNWTSVKSSGRSFGWAKATEGTGTTDPDFTVNVTHAKSAGVYIGGYHFAHPNSATPAAESGHFWSVAGGYIKADGKTLSPMLDMEVFSGIDGAASYSDWANKFCQTIVNNASAGGVKTRPAIYTSACSCQFDLSVTKWLADIADYNGQSAQTGTPWSTCSSCDAWGSGVWAAWQYSDSGAVSGISGGVDVDVFNGTTAQLVSAMVATSTSSSGSSALRADFNGDGRDDFAFFRPSDGSWHITFSSDGTSRAFFLGQNGDIPLLGGDFSGDGAADAVVFRPSNGTWYVRFSENAQIHSFSFGNSGDIPLLGGDFDGDGVPDAVIYRPSTSMWYVRFSSNGGVHSFSFGTGGDIPLMNGDFDGDGAPDAVLYRPSTGNWYVRFSGDGSVHNFAFGDPTDVPLLGDFDGDGVPDATLFRPSTGEWYVRFSTTQVTHSFQYGTNGDKPWSSYVTADHNIDQSLYRPSTGAFYVRDSSTGTFTSTVTGGTSTDIPVH